MKLARDKRLHLLLCAAAAGATGALHLIAVGFGMPWAMFAGGSAVAVGYELLQAYRGEGEASPQDAGAGIAGAAVVGLAAAILGR